MRKIIIISFFTLFLLHAVHPQSTTLFKQIDSRQSGISFVNKIQENDALNVLAYEYFYNGGGVAAGDINNDGLSDIFFTGNIVSNKLYLNKGGFEFTDITRTSGTGGRKDWKTGVSMVDINGDGWLDIYVCYSGKGKSHERRNELYINKGDLTFTEQAKQYGLDDTGCSTQAAFFDYDRDGDLDCYVLNHNIKAYKNIELHYLKTDYDTLAADRLYRNDKGRFIDVSKAAGITGNPLSFGLGIAVSDINQDGWPDLYISNDYTEQDYCYVNNGNGSFSQKEKELFTHHSQFSMGSDIADINNDGLVDIFTLDMLPEDNRRQKLLQGQENYELYQYMASNGFHYQFMRNMLHVNNGNNTFSEIGQLSGISNTDWSWAPLFADLDNDGNKDLFVTTGYLRDYTNKDFLKYWGDYLVKQAVNRDNVNYLDIIKMMPVTLLKNYAFQNSGDFIFRNMSAAWGLDHAFLSNGAVVADFDNDGNLDLVVNNINEEAALYRNEPLQDARHHYLQVALRGDGMNRFGIGATISCYTKGKMQFLEQMPVRGYQSSVSEVLHFGLGKEPMVDSLVLTWPDGKTEILFNLPADQLITVEQKNAKASGPVKSATRKKIFSQEDPFIDFSHRQLGFNDFKRQPLLPVMLSPCGPRIKTGDLNNDGRDDIFIGSSAGQASELYLQKPGGGFSKPEIRDIVTDNLSTTADIEFFDADNDGDTDIYAVSGGYGDYIVNDERLQDRLFLNDGKGSFNKALDALPPLYVSKSCAVALDVDGDGDMDIFTGGRVMPGEYPVTPQSFLLLNNGKGKFTNATEQWLAFLKTMGMITDARAVDINNDKKTDLVLTGEWMAPTILLNTGKGFTTAGMGVSAYGGWWNTLELFDADKDGDLDMIAGNWGLNSQLRASEKEPVEMIWKDFDNNGSIDPFLNYYIQGVSYPHVSRDELLDQVYPLRRKFTSYKSYADAVMTDIFSEQDLKDASRLRMTHLATSYFENMGDSFVMRSLPLPAQFSPVYKIVVEDWNEDGTKDLLLLGNNDHARLKMGKMDAGFGTLLLNDGIGNFRNAGFAETGLSVSGDVKDAAVIKNGNDHYLIIGINNKGWLNYKWNQ